MHLSKEEKEVREKELTMGISSAVEWWEEWQLRVLVLSSLAVQYVLLITSFCRQFPMKPGVRPILWLAYLGGDAIAIYALADLFNRHKNQDGSHDILEVFWAPILLIHLGGRDTITAYNIEDNELWTRHALTAVSQMTVAVYVFWKSWPGGNKTLLQWTILLFIPGILKCFEKPWALCSASITGLAKSSGKHVPRMIVAQRSTINSLQDFVEKAKAIHRPGGVCFPTLGSNVHFAPYRLFVDLASPTTDDRIGVLQRFSALDGNDAYDFLQKWLSITFSVLYTKHNMQILPMPSVSMRRSTSSGTILQVLNHWREVVTLKWAFSYTLRLFVWVPLAVSIHLFGSSIQREVYSEEDVKVTYVLLIGTYLLEFLSFLVVGITTIRASMWIRKRGFLREYTTGGDRQETQVTEKTTDDMVSQYNLIGFFIRSKKYPWMMSEFLNQRWSMKSSSSSRSITNLVLQHVRGGWEHHIQDVSSYRAFNDSRGQLTLEREKLYEKLGWTLEGPLDESVLLWHLATDFCFYRMYASSHGSQCRQDSSGYICHHKRAVHCREMSNYMVYLLYVNPEMLMAGARQHLFISAYKGLQGIIQEDKPPLEESELTEKILAAVQLGRSPDSLLHRSEEGIIHDAWVISDVLMPAENMPADKMWKVIEGVCVEMLCFSASRCRGYLHAKGLGMGIEYLSYVWLLMYYMGMETLADKLQRVDLPKGEHVADPSSSHGSRATEEKEAAGPSSSQDNGAPRTCQDNSATVEHSV